MDLTNLFLFFKDLGIRFKSKNPKMFRTLQYVFGIIGGIAGLLITLNLSFGWGWEVATAFFGMTVTELLGQIVTGCTLIFGVSQFTVSDSSVNKDKLRFKGTPIEYSVLVNDAIEKYCKDNPDVYESIVMAKEAYNNDPQFKAIIDGSGTDGTEYFAGTTAHPEVIATTKTATTLLVTAYTTKCMESNLKDLKIK